MPRPAWTDTAAAGKVLSGVDVANTIRSIDCASASAAASAARAAAIARREQLLLEGMTSSSARLRRLLGDLLTATRLDTGSVAIEARRIPLSSVLRSVVDIARAGDAEGAVIVEGRRDVEAFADPDRLGQALENLVRNGLHHGVPPVRVLVDVDESTIRIRVTDSGHGVDPAIQPRLFERFATGDHVEGSGLGLFIARELARAQGGDVSYEQGSDEHPAGAFVLTAPLAQV